MWWVILLMRLGSAVELSNQYQKLIFMLKWEGLFFFTLLFLLSCSISILFFRDKTKSLALKKFFASFSHELRTPLNAVQMQSELIDDYLRRETTPPLEIQKYATRLNLATTQLGEELQKLLYLSRVELEQQKFSGRVDLIQWLTDWSSRTTSKKNIVLPNLLEGSQKFIISADPYALDVILNNILRNAEKHHPLGKDIHLSVESSSSQVQFKISDTHSKPIGILKEKLGDIFYKSQSSQGSGIGLYLVKRLMHKMNGQVRFEVSEDFDVLLTFKRNHE
jgi:signal transduction histidine kinase